MRNRLLPFIITTGLLVFMLARLQLTGLQRPQTVIDAPESNGVIRLEFGLTAKQAREWKGTIDTSAGDILSTWGWHFILPDRITSKNGFGFTTRLFDDPKEKYRYYASQDKLPNGATILPNGVQVAIKAPDHARFTVKTNNGGFSFVLAELKAAGRLPFLQGDAAAVYTAPARSLTRGNASQHDFPSACVRGDEVYVAWVTFQNEANFVYLARLKQGKWDWYKVSKVWGDYHGSAVAADKAGNIHVVWSEYKDDRWRLVSRTLDSDAGRWSPERYVAPAGRRQTFHRMTTDAAGTPWITWQEMARNNYDIYAAKLQAGGWSTPIQLSESQANDWAPAIAAAPDGAVYVAWDGYEQGSYNVYLRSLRDGRLGPLVPVTNSDTFNAHVSVAVDPRNRVWIAWDESGPNWGKDWGVLGKPGTMLHASRQIRLVRYANGQFSEPSKLLKDAGPAWLGSMEEYPSLTIGPNGLPYVFFRHYLHRLPTPDNDPQLRFAGEKGFTAPWFDTTAMIWDILVTGFDGTDWLPVRQLPESEGRCWMQSGVAVRGQELFYVWPTDGRTYADPHVRTAQLRYAEYEITDKPAALEQMKPLARSQQPSAAPSEKQELARVHAVRWSDNPTLHLFRGDLHRHTDISLDAVKDGDIIDTYRYAIDAASLDFLGVTEHLFYVQQPYFKYDWWRVRQLASIFNNPGRFVTFYAYERTVSYPGGHRNIISTRRNLQPLAMSDEEFYGVESYGTRLFPYVKTNGDLAIPHTTATAMGTDFRENDPKAEPVVEIFQGLRGSFEQVKGPGRGIGDRPAGLVQNAWAKGLRLGVIASSDHDSTHQSFACVYAPDLTAKSIQEAIKQRRTFAATDNIILRLEAVAPDGRVFKMGQEFVSKGNPELRVSIEGTASLMKVEVIGNNRVLLARAPGTPTDVFTFRDTASPPGTAYYYIRLVQANQQVAWSSPIWVVK